LVASGWWAAAAGGSMLAMALSHPNPAHIAMNGSPADLPASGLQRWFGLNAEQALAKAMRHLMAMVLLCSCIALAIWSLDGGQLKWKALYSFCIGFSCWLIIDGLRLGLIAWQRQARLRRGLPLQAADSRVAWLPMLPICLIGIVLGPTLGMSLADSLSGGDSPQIWNLGSRAGRVTLIITLIATGVAVLGGTALGHLSALRTQAAEAQRLAAENQLRLLQSQLEPHMLFNTLANLRVLIGMDAGRAQAMLDQLIAFLRATLRASRNSSHPLADEFERLRDYLGLISIRMGTRLQFELSLPSELESCSIPPLLLQPLVENSVQHGLEPLPQGGLIRVQAVREGQHLVLTVADNGRGYEAAAPAPGRHFGLQQVRERLATLHGEAAHFEIRASAAGGTLARIELPLPAR
jgi:hypothetical protein